MSVHGEEEEVCVQEERVERERGGAGCWCWWSRGRCCWWWWWREGGGEAFKKNRSRLHKPARTSRSLSSAA